MAESKGTRLSKAARELNVGIATMVEFLSKKGIQIESKPNTKISPEVHDLLIEEFQTEKAVKEESKKIGLNYRQHESISLEDKEAAKKSTDFDEEEEEEDESKELFIKSVSGDFGKKEISSKKEPEKPKQEEKKEEKEAEETEEKPKAPVKEKEEPKEKKVEKKKEEAAEEDKDKKSEPRILGKVDLESINMKTRPDKKSRKEKKEEIEEKKKAEEKIRQEKKEEKPEKKEKEEPKPPKAEEKKETRKEPAKEAEKKTPTVEKHEKIEEKEEEKKEEKKEKKEGEKNFIPTHVERLAGPKILDKIILPESKKVEKRQARKGPRKDEGKKKPVASSTDEKVSPKKKKRRRIQKPAEEAREESRKERTSRTKKGRKHREPKPELSEEEIQKQIKETLSKLSPTGKSKAAKYRRQKRASISQAKQEEIQKKEEEKKVIKVTEFVTVNELATMIDVPVNEIISTCMALGLFVSINQRLDAETLTIVAEEFGHKVEFVSVEVQEAIEEGEELEKKEEENTVDRAPIVTVMGHVDHGKTKLLDHIRKANVIAGEAGGITQHIGAYEVTLDNEKRMVFLDTPGHEAFTAMRARGAKVTDVAIIVIAADDNVMPQTKEAINHAQAAGVPIVFAINKIDKPNANPEKIKEELSKLNILVEDWGGKYQSQEISAKQGLNVESLLEKVLLEAELLELKGNPDKLAKGTTIESSLDKGRGYVAKVLVQNGTLKIGDMVLAGAHYGKVKAMYNERNQQINEAGPSTPVLLLGLNGAPQAGDGFNVMRDEREAKEIANKRQQLQREQGIRTQKHITLDEIGRRIAIGDFKELNVIVKGDVDGSVEALSDSILKLGTQEVQVNVIHKSVGAITETDIMLASASNAIVIGFQVRPSPNARKLAETEQIDVRLYSIIYQAIEELKAAIEGMLAPQIEEKIVCNLEIRDVFKITKVGTVAGCMVLDGKITRKTNVRVIRDGIVVYTGMLGSLKRFKDDVKEVNAGYECGLNIENFNDIKVGDIIEGYDEVEVKRKI
ncbi:MAG: translation initiation factor IF-2 [Bacteroidales bacterium]|nr:translation initiation factor IF-2 [Bacteroidales bacterium]MCF8350801.1 translation initiation factor IF-2 [Bacteroidales bacterium]MCF8374786.1 translation initiation factor IF-2 [Bacteroidales bacterium]MCF8399810.1 translation initiation factor IF-2 [Bacteroidales bacterium]